MAKGSSNAELRQGFEEHLRQTSEHVSRLEQIFDLLGEKPTGKKCLGMEGLVKEGAETIVGGLRGRTDGCRDHRRRPTGRALRDRAATERCGLSRNCWAKTSMFRCSSRPWRKRKKRMKS